jgi:hypothetical protein
MVEVTVGRRLSEQWRGALPAFAAGAGKPWRAVLVVQEREGGSAVLEGARRGVAACRSRPGGARGGRGLGPDRGGRKVGRKIKKKKKEKKEEKKRRNRKRKRNRKWEKK